LQIIQYIPQVFRLFLQGLVLYFQLLVFFTQAFGEWGIEKGQVQEEKDQTHGYSGKRMKQKRLQPIVGRSLYALKA